MKPKIFPSLFSILYAHAHAQYFLLWHLLLWQKDMFHFLKDISGIPFYVLKMRSTKGRWNLKIGRSLKPPSALHFYCICFSDRMLSWIDFSNHRWTVFKVNWNAVLYFWTYFKCSKLLKFEIEELAHYQLCLFVDSSIDPPPYELWSPPRSHKYTWGYEMVTEFINH